MERKSKAMQALMASWNGQVMGGYRTHEEMVISLQEQIGGVSDLAPDELTDDMCDIMGWDYDEIGASQFDEWDEIVNMAAREWLGDRI